MSIETVRHEGRVLAVIAKTQEINNSLTFISPDEFPLQVGLHTKPENFLIEAHEHFPFTDIASLDCQEIFYIQKGKLEIGLYHKGERVCSRIMGVGDLIILNTGHDIKFLEETKMVEIKQGPYRGKENEKRYIPKK